MNPAREKPRYTPEDPWLKVRQVAAELNIGVSTVWHYTKLGRLPRPVYVGPRSPRWRRSAILASIGA